MSPSIESSVKGQFAKIFSTPDWRLFKEMAEVSFLEAAFLKKTDLKRVPVHRRLLVRNSRKRLLIGIGTELLLKALYLKNGFCINKPKAKPYPTFPFKPTATVPLNEADTYTIDQLISGLTHIITLPADASHGLKVAKVFRNKEGHIVTSQHKFDPASFRAIEKALIALYEDGFKQRLAVRFSLAPGETATFSSSPLS